MDATELALGPAPFRYTPTQPGGVEGPAYTPAFKLLAAAVVAWALAWAALLWWQGTLQAMGPAGPWMLAGLALMAYTAWHILRGRTRVDEAGLFQSWVWDKRIDARDLAFCRLMRVPGLDWLLAPRLYARTLGGRFAVFYAGSPALVAEFVRLERELAAFRIQQMR